MVLNINDVKRKNDIMRLLKETDIILSEIDTSEPEDIREFIVNEAIFEELLIELDKIDLILGLD